jgi:predicted RNA polymerase sigma factor
LVATGTATWYRAGVPPVPIRWLLVRDPKGELDAVRAELERASH